MQNIQPLTIVAFVLLFIAQNLFSQEDDEGWKQAKVKNGIEVYTRTPEGSKFKEYKAITTVEAEPRELVDLVLDVDNYTDWMANIKYAELSEMPDSNTFYCYSEIKVPWPFDNRDNITKSVILLDAETGAYTIDITLAPEYVPQKKGLIRIVEGRGKWVFTPMGEGKTKVYHQFIADPAGNIPAWVVNMFIVDGPHKTLLGMKAEVGEDN